MEKKIKRRKSNTDDDSELTLLKDVARSLKILVRIGLDNIRGDRNQKDMILLLDSIGCGHTEIAEILGISQNSVGPALSRGRRSPNKRRGL
jgi:DNA-directed RNA polymerase specialized sigma24 family protein